MFNPTFWAVTQPLGQNNPIVEFVQILTSAGLHLTQHFLECIEKITVLVNYLSLSTAQDAGIGSSISETLHNTSGFEHGWMDVVITSYLQAKCKNVILYYPSLSQGQWLYKSHWSHDLTLCPKTLLQRFPQLFCLLWTSLQDHVQ